MYHSSRTTKTTFMDIQLKSLQNIILTVGTLLLSGYVSAQEFAPVGAKWTVELSEAFEPSWIGTLTNESLRDTVLQGLACKVMFKSQSTTDNPISGEYILCQAGDSIFHYMPELDTLNLVMDFGAEVGDSWESFDESNSSVAFGAQFIHKYLVTSIGYLDLENGDSLRVQHIQEYAKGWGQADSEYQSAGAHQLIQHIGFRRALLQANDGDGLTDDISQREIRCYEDSNIGLVKLTSDQNCLPSSVRNLNIDNIYITPNPASSILNIDNQSEFNFDQIVLLDQLGSKVLETEFNEYIDISQLNNGHYIIQLKNEKLLWSSKVIIIR